MGWCDANERYLATILSNRIPSFSGNQVINRKHDKYFIFKHQPGLAPGFT